MNMDMNTNNEMLWLVFKISNQLYAINSDYVTSIVTMPSKITRVPFTPRFIRGIFNLMGKIVPSIEMRLLLNKQTQEQEQSVMFDMLEQRKHDHEHWVDEFIHCVDDKLPFKLETNPHRCTLGRWMDSFKSEDHSLALSLSKLKEPHEELHHLAYELANAQADSLVGNDYKAKAIGYKNSIMSLIDMTKSDILANQKELCIIVNYEDKVAGLICDDVVVVGKVDMIEKTKQNKLNEHISWIRDLAVTVEKQPIFVIDTADFFNSYDAFLTPEN